MADNFLERHYADYEARKAAWLKAKKMGKTSLRKTKPAAKADNTGKTGNAGVVTIPIQTPAHSENQKDDNRQ